jgi:L-ascorbate metabolism protein UlaG (beta-lactamase superfamily)
MTKATSRSARLASAIFSVIVPIILPAILGIGILATVGVAVVDAASPAGPRLTWFGQSCFLLESAAGTRVVMDPIPAAGLGYTPPKDLKADLVTVSHEHGDHNNVALVGGNPTVLRGLTADKKDWVKIEQKVKDVSVRSVGVYHDDQSGKQRGLNAVFIFEVGGLRVAHLGDLGHLLTEQQLATIGPVDVVLIPVGGFFTIDGRQAAQVVEQLHPSLIVIPMHYKTDVLTIKELASVDAFLEGHPEARREKGNSLVLTAGKGRGKGKGQGQGQGKGKGQGQGHGQGLAGGKPEIVVLNYK